MELNWSCWRFTLSLFSVLQLKLKFWMQIGLSKGFVLLQSAKNVLCKNKKNKGNYNFYIALYVTSCKTTFSTKGVLRPFYCKCMSEQPLMYHLTPCPQWNIPLAVPRTFRNLLWIIYSDQVKHQKRTGDIEKLSHHNTKVDVCVCISTYG